MNRKLRLDAIQRKKPAVVELDEQHEPALFRLRADNFLEAFKTYAASPRHRSRIWVGRNCWGNQLVQPPSDLIEGIAAFEPQSLYLGVVAKAYPLAPKACRGSLGRGRRRGCVLGSKTGEKDRSAGQQFARKPDESPRTSASCRNCCGERPAARRDGPAPGQK